VAKTLEEIIYQVRWIDAFGKNGGLSMATDKAIAIAIREAGYAPASEVLLNAVEALNKEAIFFQGGWGSNPEDVARADGIAKTMTWMEARAAGIQWPERASG
jgi:hypothetical protein